MSRKLLGVAFVVLALAAAATAQAATFDDFNTAGDLGNGLSSANWTVTSGTAWVRSATMNGGGGLPYEGAAACTSYGGSGGNSAVGTITSTAFTLDGNLLQFDLLGFAGTRLGNGNNAYNNQQAMCQIANQQCYWQLYLSGSNTLLANGTATSGNTVWRDTYVDVSGYQGQSAYLKLTDNYTDLYGWFAIDDIRTGNRDATSLFTCESTQQNRWALTGTSFGYYSINQFGSATTSNGPETPTEGGELLRGNDTGTGTATSTTFTITRSTLNFWSGGFGSGDGHGTSNNIQLVRASDGTVLHTWTTLGGNPGMAQTFDVSAWANVSAYLVLNDVTNGGYGWVGIDDVRLTGTTLATPEPGTLALLAAGLLGLLCYAWRKRR